MIAPFSNIDIVFPSKSTVIIGREDEAVDIDLSPYNALQMGISRHHACVRVQNGQVLIEDLQSTNGTAVNEQMLLPNQPRQVQHGDEIRLGRMLLTVQIG